jgi:hypothetical protein
MKEHPTHKGYFITEDGKVYNSNKKELRPWITKDGYLQIRVARKSTTVHRLVAETYLENPNNFPVVNHLNRQRIDNRVENLEWTTTQKNVEYSCAKKYTLQNIHTNETFVVINLNKWCQERDMVSSALTATLTGNTRKQHKGYKVLEINNQHHL